MRLIRNLRHSHFPSFHRHSSRRAASINMNFCYELRIHFGVNCLIAFEWTSLTTDRKQPSPRRVTTRRPPQATISIRSENSAQPGPGSSPVICLLYNDTRPRRRHGQLPKLVYRQPRCRRRAIIPQERGPV